MNEERHVQGRNVLCVMLRREHQNSLMRHFLPHNIKTGQTKGPSMLQLHILTLVATEHCEQLMASAG